MSDFKHQPGNGTIFQNASTNPKAPKLSGQFTDPDGKVWEIALWTATFRDGTPKRDKNGAKFFSVLVNEPRMQERPAPVAASEPYEDDIPF